MDEVIGLAPSFSPMTSRPCLIGASHFIRVYDWLSMIADILTPCMTLNIGKNRIYVLFTSPWSSERVLKMILILRFAGHGQIIFVKF